MDATEVFTLSHDALYVLIIVSAPAMLAALIVGLIISFFQAITQIQETTLTFVPKILMVFLTLAFSMSFILNTLTDFNQKIHDRIATIE